MQKQHLSNSDPSELSDLSGDLSGPQCERGVIARGGGRWSTAIVKARLAEAAHVTERSTRRDGPRFVSGLWPNYEMEFSDLVQAGADARERQRRARNRTKWIPSPIELRRADEAIIWPARYLAAPEHNDARRLVQLFMFCAATGAPWSRVIAHLDVSESTADRRRRSGFVTIMIGLIDDGIEP